MSEAIEAAYKAAVGESARRKEQVVKLKAELEQVRKEFAAVQAERDEFASKIADAEKLSAAAQEQIKNAAPELAKQIHSLQMEIKARDFKEAFKAAAKDKIRDDAIDAAMKLYGSMPDEFTPESLSEGITSLIESNAFLAPSTQPDPAASGSRGADASGKPTLNPAPPGPGVVRGGSQPAQGVMPPALAQGQAYLQKTGRDSAYRIA